jgi:ABC-type lipoprotein release transport system permease subunit
MMGGPMVARVAWRNLWRQKRRTLLTLSSIVFGTFLAVLMTALQDRSFADMIDSAARLGGGHVTIQHPEYLDKPSLTRTITRGDELRRIATSDPDVERAVERIAGQTVVATARDSFGAFFIAYDPTTEDEDTMAFAEALIEGEMHQAARGKGIVLGKKLAQNLDVELGKKVVYTVMDKHGEIVSGMGRLSGIIETHAPSLDGGLCLLPIDTVRDVLGYGPDESTYVAAFLSDSRRSGAVAGRLDAAVGEDAAALTWDEIQTELASFIAMKVGGGRVMEIIVAVLVAAGIFNTLFVSVMERTREFGIMMAIGHAPRQLFAMVMLESLWLAIVGLAAAAIVTIGPYLYLANTGIDMSAMTGGTGTEVAGVGFDPVLRVGIFPENVLLIGIAVLIATLAAGLYPAWRAGTVVPVESIKLV